jgi:predicted permease
MLKNYLIVAWRNLVKSKLYSSINLIGLATGMAVAILIGLWIYDELSYDKSFSHYDRLGKVWQYVSFTKNEKSAYDVTPIPLATELRTKYPDFKYVSITSGSKTVILAAGEKKISNIGSYVQPDMTEMLSLRMVTGDRHALKDMHAILLSASLARTIFGKEDPMGKRITLDNNDPVEVAGVYEDFPYNSSFKEVGFLAAWDLFATKDYVKNSLNEWDNNSFNMYAELKEGADFATVSARIRESRMKQPDPPKYHPEFFLFPMRRWHLYADFTNGVNTGGLITFVWLFGIIGVFVLLLACINFMNLSTARSEKRAREVGIRKAIGSERRQLIVQFFSESLMVALFAFCLALLLVTLLLPLFNAVADKKISLPWSNPLFWAAGIGFSLFTGLIAGSYPALYLSSFSPVKVLKGTFKAGRFAAIPRRVMVVVQFSVSVLLIIGTMIVFRQIQFARNLPMGYKQNGLIEVGMQTKELYTHAKAIRTELLASGAVEEMTATSCPMNAQYGGTTDFTWKGKDPNARPLVISNGITPEFGKTVGWQLVQGRDLSRAFATDSSAMILNEAAVKLTGISKPLGETITQGGRAYTVVGVVKDMIREDPFQPVKPAFYVLTKNNVNTMLIKLDGGHDIHAALDKVAKVFQQYNPASPFDYRWVDEEYGKKFGNEERIGKLSSCFAVLAIFISCLGLFGLASFVAEQRTKEIGVRKVLGATVFILWRLLSKEFIVLVAISLLIAMPVAYYFMQGWLQNYTYHTHLSWWIFAAAGGGALLITLLTVSFQAVRAAMANPVRSLRSE